MAILASRGLVDSSNNQWREKEIDATKSLMYKRASLTIANATKICVMEAQDLGGTRNHSLY